MKRRFLGLVAATLAAVLATPTNAADPAADWPARTLADLAGLQQLLQDNTPIPFDDDNPHNKTWLKEGLALAQQRAATVTNQAGWLYTLSAYANGFGDPHVRVDAVGPLPQARWPGFIAAARGKDAVVVAVDPAEATPARTLRVGTRLLACDGKPIPTLLAERVFPFVMNPRLPGDQRRAVTRLFLDRQNPFAPPPQACDIELDGQRQQVSLSWRDLPGAGPESPEQRAWWQQYQDAGIGPGTRFGVNEPAPGITWIGVPTFSSGPDTAPQLEDLIRDVQSRGDTMRQGRAIVIDTRGNGGGNSVWADRLAQAIFGSDVLRLHRPPSSTTATDWRASAGNIAFWREWEQQAAREFGSFSTNRLGVKYLVNRLESALAADEWLYRQGASSPGPTGGMTHQRPTGPSPFPARVLLLSNGSCGSSCLNFADTVLFVPGVQLVGAATSGDGMLMDVRGELLPSRLARLTLPQKVARGRGRGHLEVYLPDRAYDGPWDDASVRAWVLERAQE